MRYMTIYDNLRSMSFIDFCPRSLRFNIFKLLFLKKHQTTEAKFHMEPPWDVGNENVFKYSRLDLQEKNSIFGTKRLMTLEPWYTASGIQVLPNLFS